MNKQHTAYYHFLYLHGYQDSPTCEQGENIQHWLNENYPDSHYDFPQLSINPDTLITQAEQSILQSDTRQCVIIANSLGGYIAHIIKQKHPERISKVILINPVVNLKKIIQERDYDQETINDAEYLMQQYPKTITCLNDYLLLLQRDDRSVDSQYAIHNFQGARIHVSEGQGHQYNNLPFNIINTFIQSSG